MEPKLVHRYLQPVDIDFPATETANVATVVKHSDSQQFFLPLAGDICDRLVVPTAVTLAPLAPTPVLVKDTGSQTKFIETIGYKEGHGLLRVAKKIVIESSTKPVHI